MQDLKNCIREKANPIQINQCRTLIDNYQQEFLQLSGVLALTGNEVRLKILYLLGQQSELCPCDLSDILNMTIPAISQHLRKLKDGNVIKFRKEGQTIFYSLKNSQLELLQPFFKIIDQKNLMNELV